MRCGMLAGLPGGRESDGKCSSYTPDFRSEARFLLKQGYALARWR